jgi:hypothetical protein
MEPTNPRRDGGDEYQEYGERYARGGNPEHPDDLIMVPPALDPSGRPARERPIGRLFSELLRELRQLVRGEARLARAEFGEKLHQAGSGAGTLGAGALVAFAGFLFLLLSATFGLDLWLRTPWLSALIVGGVVALIGLGMVAKGRSELKAEHLAPERTARSLQRDAELAQRELQELRELRRTR